MVLLQRYWTRYIPGIPETQSVLKVFIESAFPEFAEIQELYDQLIKQREKWQIENQDSYSLPISYFDFELTHLLVYLHHLDPQTIPLPSVTTVPDLITANLKQVVNSVTDNYREIERKIRAIAGELSWQFTILDSMALARGKELEIKSYLWEQNLTIAGQNYVLQVTVREDSGELIYRFLLKNAVKNLDA